MKIHDILTENEIKEAWGSDLAKLAGKGITWLFTRGGAKELAELMSKNTKLVASTLKGLPPTAADVGKIYGPKAEKLFTSDPNFMSKVLTKFHADRALAKGASTASKASSAASQTASSAGQTAADVAKAGAVGGFVRASGKVMTILKFLGIGKMVYDYYKDVEWAEGKVKSGEWNPEQFADYRQGKMTVLVTQIAASVVLFNVIKIFSGWSFFTNLLRMSRVPAISGFGSFLAGLDKAAQLGIIAVAQTQGARKWIAELIGTGVVDNVLGGTGVELVDKAKEVLGIKSDIPKPEAKPDSGTADAGGKQDVDSTSGVPVAPSTPLPGATASKNVALGDNPTMFRKPNGELDIGLDPEFMDKKPKK